MKAKKIKVKKAKTKAGKFLGLVSVCGSFSQAKAKSGTLHSTIDAAKAEIATVLKKSGSYYNIDYKAGYVVQVVAVGKKNNTVDW